MKTISLPLLAASLFLLGSPAFAQAPPAPQHAPDGGTHESFESIFIPSMPNAPFTATVNTEWIRQSPDGGNITLVNHRSIARDGKGRTFQERAWFVPNDGKHESTAYQIEISDPGAHERYVCRTAERVCRLQQFFTSNFVASSAAADSQGKPGAPGIESLGTQNVSGLETIGSRETTLVETQTIGNDAPILERKEFWYSPQLGVNLITKRQDARFATQQNFEVTNVALGEPDAKLFEPPTDYKILDMRKPPEISPKQDTSQN
jgi:hypothetical protein